MARRERGSGAGQDEGARPVVERVQTGVRMEKRLVKVLKALAEYKDMTLGDLLEGIVLHAFEGKTPFGDETLRLVAEFRRLYGLELDASSSHRLVEARAARGGGTSRRGAGDVRKGG